MFYKKPPKGQNLNIFFIRRVLRLATCQAFKVPWLLVERLSDQDWSISYKRLIDILNVKCVTILIYLFAMPGIINTWAGFLLPLNHQIKIPTASRAIWNTLYVSFMSVAIKYNYDIKNDILIKSKNEIFRDHC